MSWIDHRKPGSRRGLALACAAAILAATPRATLACAACYGQSDSPMAAGMNWGIFSLLGIIGCVLGGVAGFFIFLSRRAKLTSAPPGQLSFADLAARSPTQDRPHRHSLHRAGRFPSARHCASSGRKIARGVPAAHARL